MGFAGKIFSILMFALFIIDLHAQVPIKHSSYTRQRKVTAFQEILDLKKNCLFIMLHSKHNKIVALRSVGREKDAEDIANKQSRKNKEIISTFKKKFNVCPVYFFCDTEAANLITKGTKNLVLVNDSLKSDSTIQPCT